MGSIDSEPKGAKVAKREKAISYTRLPQANDVTYELHTLGWKAFQDLCATITSEVWGQTVQKFFAAYDAGRDGAFKGKWKPEGGEAFSGSFTVQCKFISKRDGRLRLSDLADEFEKAKKLASRGLATNYIIMTNASLTARSEAEMKRAFERIPRLKRFAGYGGEWISRVIRETPRLRMLVPRVYGLGDLSQILDERAYAQAREVLSALGDDLAKFVITEPFRRSAKALVNHGFVLLLGEPASGKSTIAAALAVGATDVWNCSTVKVRDADDFVKHWNPNEPKQFFWVDDAFGTTQYYWASAPAWNYVFPHIQAAIRKGARVLFTSRDYIYRSAKHDLKETAFPLIRESQVVINVEDLTKDEKEQILYNHIRLGTQPKQFRQKLKPFLPGVAANRYFLPEIARRLGNPLFTKSLVFAESEIAKFVNEPLELLLEVIRTLDNASRAALALVFMRGGNLASPINLSSDEQRALVLLGSTVADVREALNSLRGSLVIQALEAGNYIWRFKHPTVRDAFGALVAEDPELLDIYLIGTPARNLVEEVACGNIGIEGTKVVVSEDRFDLIIRRLGQMDKQRMSEDQRRLHNFLSHRCDRSFLQQYLAKNPDFVEGLPVWSYLNAISEVPVFIRLYKLGHLPEDQRIRLINEIKKLAVDTPDAGFLENKDLRAIFSVQELKDTLAKVRDDLLPNLHDVIIDWKSNYPDWEGDPESYFDALIDALKTYRAELASDQIAMLYIDRALERIDETICELAMDAKEYGDKNDFSARSSKFLTMPDTRSVFDDVDD
jgi:hypothetical protein